jgi:hypothetical protein
MPLGKQRSAPPEGGWEDWTCGITCRAHVIFIFILLTSHTPEVALAVRRTINTIATYMTSQVSFALILSQKYASEVRARRLSEVRSEGSSEVRCSFSLLSELCATSGKNISTALPRNSRLSWLSSQAPHLRQRNSFHHRPVAPLWTIQLSPKTFSRSLPRYDKAWPVQSAVPHRFRVPCCDSLSLPFPSILPGQPITALGVAHQAHDYPSFLHSIRVTS